MWLLSTHISCTSLVIQSATWEISFEPLSCWLSVAVSRAPGKRSIEGEEQRASALKDNMTVSAMGSRGWCYCHNETMAFAPSFTQPAHKGHLSSSLYWDSSDGMYAIVQSLLFLFNYVVLGSSFVCIWVFYFWPPVFYLGPNNRNTFHR